ERATARGRSGVERRLKELQAVASQRVLALSQRTPDRNGSRDFANLGRERLDHRRAGIVDFMQRCGDRRPRQVILAWRAAVVRTTVEMKRFVAGRTNSVGDA